MPIDPMEMRTSVVMKEFMENYSREYRRAGFTEEECVETIAIMNRAYGMLKAWK